MRKVPLIGRIFICLVCGILIGISCKNVDFILPIKVLSTIGDLFKNFLTFVIPLIIIAFIIPGIATLGRKSGKGLIITTILAYVSTITAGSITYIIGINLLPRVIKASSLIEKSGEEIKGFFNIDIPPIMDIMSALILAFILGIGLSKIKNSVLLKCTEEFAEVITNVVTKILVPFVPIYIGCIFARLSYNGEIFTTLKSFAIVYIILFTIQISYIILQYSIAGGIIRENPFKLIKNMMPAYFTAVGTQSSAATIPVTLQSVKSNNVSKEVYEFVVPLCATIHLAGDTITLVITSMAVMYMNGQTPTITTVLAFILMLGVTMIAAPGVPGGGVMAALGLLQTMFGFGDVEQSIMIALHTAQDSFGTATNVTGDGAIAIIIDYILNKSDKEKGLEVV